MRRVAERRRLPIFPIASAAVEPAGTSRIFPSGSVTFGMTGYRAEKVKKAAYGFFRCRVSAANPTPIINEEATLTLEGRKKRQKALEKRMGFYFLCLNTKI